MKPSEALPDYLVGLGRRGPAVRAQLRDAVHQPDQDAGTWLRAASVVSTSIRDVVHPYGDAGFVHIADDRDGFIAATEAALRENRAARWQKVDRFLADASWDAVVRDMNRLITRAVRPAAAAVPFQQAEASLSHVATRERSGGGAMIFDYMIVGAGFAGSVLAERLARGSNKQVLLVDRRPHIGGNAYDHYDEHGILVHKYGPHIFHTNSHDVFAYLSRFTEWRPYQHRVQAWVDGQLLPIPINLDTVNRLYGMSLTSFDLDAFFERVAEPREKIRTSEDVIVSKVGRELYEKFFRNYTRKQWGLDPSELDAQVTARIPVRTNRDDRYFTDMYQAMPRHGYTRMFENMLDHDNIKILLNTDYRDLEGAIPYDELIYTGPIDEFFECRYGKLPYRSLSFRFETHDTAQIQPAAVINYPNDQPYTRVTEFKYLTGQVHPKTSLVYEFPCDEGDPYYPVPRAENAETYQKYEQLAKQTPGVRFVGRLATYKYYNMDQVTAQALSVYKKIVGTTKRELAPAVTVATTVPVAARPRESLIQPVSLER